MFTGIIRFLGTVTRSEPLGGDHRIHVRCPGVSAGAANGDSIAVNGVCLTVTGLADEGFSADVSRETLRLTTLGDLRPGDVVNIEPALAVGERLGGHFVSGHVDGIGTVRSVAGEARSQVLVIDLPDDLARYTAKKGSICVDGVSLTINAVSGSSLSLNIIPHTAEVTTLGRLAAGSPVNIEVDLLARYLERLLAGTPDGDNETSKLTHDFLKAHGYA